MQSFVKMPFVIRFKLEKKYKLIVNKYDLVIGLRITDFGAPKSESMTKLAIIPSTGVDRDID